MADETVIGKYAYSTQEQLGKGTFSVVYRGHLINQEHFQVAVKVINIQKCDRQCLNEISIMKNIHSDNIVQIYDSYINQDKYLCYIIMELCSHSLQDIYKQLSR